MQHKITKLSSTPTVAITNSQHDTFTACNTTRNKFVTYNTLAASYNTEINRYTNDGHVKNKLMQLMNMQHSTRTNSVQLPGRDGNCQLFIASAHYNYSHVIVSFSCSKPGMITSITEKKLSQKLQNDSEPSENFSKQSRCQK